MNSSNWIEGSLTISGREIGVRNGVMRQSDLRFYVDNPRIYSIVRRDEVSPTQGEIERRLQMMDHVKQLIQSIRANGGLIDPLIVRDGDLVVLEGNSRLAAYRALATADPITWGNVKVTLLPSNISERLVFALLGEYHIIGRKDWAPYEQAGYLYRRVENQGVTPQRIANEMGMTVNAVNKLLEVYRFMVDQGEDDVNRWSYYEEYLKPQVSKRARERHPDLDSVVVAKVNTGEIENAVAVRNQVMKILKGGDKSIRIFTSGPGTIERALISAADRGVDNPWLSRLKRFRIQLSEDNTVAEFREMNPGHRQKAEFEFRKIEARLKRLRKEIG